MEPFDNCASASRPSWSGEVWVVAGGPSARAFDLRRLRGRRVLSVNGHWLEKVSSSEVGTSAVAIFSLDNDWIRRNRGLIVSHEGEKFLAVPLETWPDCGGIAGVEYLGWSHALGLSDDPARVCCGCNSGYGALNLAYLRGATEIHLVGYDMNPADDERYFYWAPLFRDALPQLKARGVRVLNHNRFSFIDAFPKVD